MKKLILVAVLALVAFAAPAVATPTGSTDDDSLPRLPHKVCQLRTDTMCQQPTSTPGEERYRIIDDGLFCTEVIRDAGTSYAFHCNPWWPAKNPVINARLKPKPTPPAPKTQHSPALRRERG